MTTIQDNVNNYYFKNKADFEAHKAEIPNNSTIYIEETGEVNVEINGTETANVENLTNIVVGDKTYKASVTIDSELSETSENAVQNKIVTESLNDKVSLTKNEVINGQKIFTKRPQIGEVRLPNEFTEVEYIESTGTQYIDTGFTPNQDTRIDVNFRASNVTNNNAVIYGSGVNHQTRNFELYTEAGNLWGYKYDGAQTVGNAYVNGYVESIQNKNIVINISNGVQTNYTFATKTFTTPYTLTLFALHRESIIYSAANIKLYKCAIYDNGILVRNFIPCYTNKQVTNNSVTYEANTIGLYDIANNIFYINNGTGIFRKGKDIITGEYVALQSELPVANPQENILINGDFKFNQRLMTAYYGPNVYGPDRWQIMDEAAGCASTNDNSWEVSIEEVTTAGSRYIIAQNIENYKALSDTDVTAHIEYKDLTEDVAGTTYLCIYDGATETSQVLSSSNTSATVTAHIKSDPRQIEVYLKTGSTSLNMSMKVYYMKLEQGKNYTGKYYSNYETELARCQRFYQPVQVLGLTNIPSTTKTILVSANLITSLRTKPTASILFGSRMPSVTGNGATIACNGVTVNKFHTTSAILQFNLKTEATLLQLYTITTDCNIALDSEIYFTLGNN